MKLFKKLKEFAVKGNMIEIATGVIIGAAFNKVLDVLVKEIFLPPLSLITNGISWEHKKTVLTRCNRHKRHCGNRRCSNCLWQARGNWYRLPHYRVYRLPGN